MNAVDRLQRLRVADVMSRRMTTIGANETLCQAAVQLAGHHVSGAPVVDETGHCVGVLTSNDFVRHIAEQAEGEAQGWRGGEFRLERANKNSPLQVRSCERDQVRDHMSSAVQTISEDATLLAAAHEMCQSHIHHLLVLSSTGSPVGMVTTLDVVAALLQIVDESARGGRER